MSMTETTPAHTNRGAQGTGGRLSTETASSPRRHRVYFSFNRSHKHHDPFGRPDPNRRRYFGKPSFSGFRPHFMAGLGEFIGTTMFLFLAEGGAKTAQLTKTAAQDQTATQLSNEQIMFIAFSFGMSLLVTAWMFYRITGGLFNPAITIALWLILGGIAGAALVLGLTPSNSVQQVTTTLQLGINITQGFLIGMLLTSILVFSVLMLAVEKHRATYLAPVGIGLTLMAAHLVGAVWTGCGPNPARSFGPAVVAGQFNSDHWVYWTAPVVEGSLAVCYHTLLKKLRYSSVVLDQDSDTEITGLKPMHVRLWNFIRHGEKPSALNPESSTHYGKKARDHFDKEQKELFEKREEIRREMMDKPVFEGHANEAAMGRMSEKCVDVMSTSSGSTTAHSNGPILPQ